MKAPRLKWPAAFDLARSDDGRLLACLGRNVVVIDMHGRTRVSTSYPVSHPSSASFSPDGALLAVKATSGQILIASPETGTVIRDFKNQKEGEGCDLHFSPDGDALIDGSWGGDLTIRRIDDGMIVMRQQHPGEMLTSVSRDLARRLWLVQHSLKCGPDGSPSQPGYISLHRWPFADGVAQTITFGMHIKAVELSPDGTRFCFIQERDEPRIHIARVSDGQIITSSSRIKAGWWSELAWSTNGEYIGAVAEDGFAFYRASDLSVVGGMATEYPSSIMFMPDDQKVILGSWKTTKVAPSPAAVVEPTGNICAR